MIEALYCGWPTDTHFRVDNDIIIIIIGGGSFSRPSLVATHARTEESDSSSTSCVPFDLLP